MKGEGTTVPNEIATKEETMQFWRGLWENPFHHEKDTPWMKFLADDYCKDVYEKDYEITDEVLEKVLKRLANDKPGRDLVAGLWLKRLKSIKEEYKQELTKLLNNEMEPPE